LVVVPRRSECLVKSTNTDTQRTCVCSYIKYRTCARAPQYLLCISVDK
jgi:hypothetical protein